MSQTISNVWWIILAWGAFVAILVLLRAFTEHITDMILDKAHNVAENEDYKKTFKKALGVVAIIGTFAAIVVIGIYTLFIAKPLAKNESSSGLITEAKVQIESESTISEIEVINKQSGDVLKSIKAEAEADKENEEAFQKAMKTFQNITKAE